MTPGQKMTVLVVDDHPIMRLGVTAIINAQSDMRVCAQAASGEEAVRVFKKHRPDITLMDLRLPGMSGRDVLSLMVHGKSNKEIAAALAITEATVKCHVSVILMRLEANDRTQAVIAALQRGLEHL